MKVLFFSFFNIEDTRPLLKRKTKQNPAQSRGTRSPTSKPGEEQTNLLQRYD
jgi:hypothetical protein